MNMPEAAAAKVGARKFPCHVCPLRPLRTFRPFTEEELEFVNRFKSGELEGKAGTTLLLEGSNSDYLYTVLMGWLFRYKTLPDGRRQILNYAMPGDFVGLQTSVFDEVQHSVEALTDVVLCVFPRTKLWSLYAKQPGLGFDVTWLAAREEKMLDDHLLSVGRRSAKERIAYLVLHLFRRARELKLTDGNAFKLPINQQHVADTLGMSLVHTNKTLRKLFDLKLIEWRSKTLSILDYDALAALARLDGHASQVRPLI